MNGVDRFGLAWRDEIAASVLAHRDRIDLVEVIAEDWFGASRARRDALRALAREIPVSLHGVSLGLASAARVDERRLAAMARLVEAVRPAHWSEHLAFVRAGGVEIGHLAAPPRTEHTVAGAVRNIARATAVVGMPPRLENVATLLLPPGPLCETDWITACVVASGADLLLDMHNLYANAANAGMDPLAMLESLPLHRVRSVHLAGGRWIGPRTRRRLLDDHLHAVPEAVYSLLTELGARAVQPLEVVIERDGDWPPFAELLRELDLARTALAVGRARCRGVA
jgi:uncharacterized protein (UPF0276 family)